MKFEDLNFLPAECCGEHFTATVVCKDKSYLEIRRQGDGTLLAIMKSPDGYMLKDVKGIESGMLLNINEDDVNTLLSTI